MKMGNHNLGKKLKELLDDSEWEDKQIKFDSLLDNNMMFHTPDYFK